MKRVIAIILLVGWPSVALAILGCLRDERDLAKRSTAVVVVNIQKVGKATVASCPESKPASPREITLGGRTYESGYAECGEVGVLKATVVESLRGDLSGTLDVLVGTPSGLVLGPCDDRPDLPKMAGLQAVLYLRRDGSRWWTLDGPDSIYTLWPQPTLGRDFIMRVKQLLAEPPTK